MPGTLLLCGMDSVFWRAVDPRATCGPQTTLLWPSQFSRQKVQSLKNSFFLSLLFQFTIWITRWVLHRTMFVTFVVYIGVVYKATVPAGLERGCLFDSVALLWMIKLIFGIALVFDAAQVCISTLKKHGTDYFLDFKIWLEWISNLNCPVIECMLYYVYNCMHPVFIHFFYSLLSCLGHMTSLGH